MDLLVIIPVFNDWASAEVVAAQVWEGLRGRGLAGEILLVDDGSTEPAPKTFLVQHAEVCVHASVLELRRNLGHQRAIAVALAYAADKTDCPAAVLMDGDGEDQPADVLRLYDAWKHSTDPRQVVFAARQKRSEGAAFQLGYLAFKVIHRVLVGHPVRVGNFSLIPRAALQRLAVMGELWNHYAAAVVKGRIPYSMIPTQRGQRLFGRSRMNTVSLAVHGLSAMSVFGDIIGVRVIGATALLGCVTLAGILAIVAIRLLTNLAIPGWATYSVGLLVVILLQSAMLAILFVFMVLSNRQSMSFLPARDYPYFVGRVRALSVPG
jgi:hypothetical protein